MKNLRLAAIAALTVFAFSSCEKKEYNEMNSFLEQVKVMKSGIVEMWPGKDGCGLEVYDLFGGQTIHMGTVSVVTFGGSVFVKYEANEGCLITETHLFVGDIADLPVNGGGNPVIGHFPYSWEDGDGQQVVIHEIELDDTECFDIAAHAVVKCENGGAQTAWAKESPVFAIKSLVEKSPNTVYVITGSPVISSQEYWCMNFRYYRLSQVMGSTIDLVYYYRGSPAYGNVTVEKVGDKVRFTIRSNTGNVLTSSLFVGRIRELNEHGICNHSTFPYKATVPGAQHIFEIPLSDLFNGDAFTFAGNRWGWYISDYCPDC